MGEHVLYTMPVDKSTLRKSLELLESETCFAECNQIVNNKEIRLLMEFIGTKQNYVTVIIRASKSNYTSAVNSFCNGNVTGNLRNNQETPMPADALLLDKNLIKTQGNRNFCADVKEEYADTCDDHTDISDDEIFHALPQNDKRSSPIQGSLVVGKTQFPETGCNELLKTTSTGTAKKNRGRPKKSKVCGRSIDWIATTNNVMRMIEKPITAIKEETHDKNNTPEDDSAITHLNVISIPEIAKLDANDNAKETSNVLNTSSENEPSTLEENEKITNNIANNKPQDTNNSSEDGANDSFESAKKAQRKSFGNYRPTIRCKYCPIKATNELFMNRHMRSHHPENFVITPELYQYEHHEGPVICKYCKRGLVDKSGLYRHMKRNHGKETNLKEELSRLREESNIKCPYCPVVLKGGRSAQMKDHINTVHSTTSQSIPCEVCGTILKNAANLKNHLRFTHKTVKDVQCNECGLFFKSTSYLIAHKHTYHSTNTFSCPIAGCVFTTHVKRYVRAHVRCTHGEATLECTLCTHKCKTKSKLQLHMRLIHQIGNLEKYKCPDCDKEFNLKNNMNKHINTVHRKKYTCFCSFCNLGFFGSKALEKHIERVHNATADDVNRGDAAGDQRMLNVKVEYSF